MILYEYVSSCMFLRVLVGGVSFSGMIWGKL